MQNCLTIIWMADEELDIGDSDEKEATHSPAAVPVSLSERRESHLPHDAVMGWKHEAEEV